MLGLSQQQRDKSFPDVPTFIEQGYNVDIPVYYGVIVPAGTPQGIVDILEGAVKKATMDKEFVQKNLPGMTVLGYMSYTPDTVKADLDGRSPFDASPVAVEEARKIKTALDQLLKK